MNIILLKKILSPLYKFRYRIKCDGWIYIGKHSKIVNPKQIFLSNGTQISPFSLICAHDNAEIHIGNAVNIGMFSRIAANNHVFIGDNVFSGPNIFISDYNHVYEDVNIPIVVQGNTAAVNKVIIEDDCWIGTNVVICGNVHIGKHSVIGACSFVNKDIPEFCVAVGNPIKIIKRYNFEKQEWVIVNDE